MPEQLKTELARDPVEQQVLDQVLDQMLEKVFPVGWPVDISEFDYNLQVDNHKRFRSVLDFVTEIDGSDHARDRLIEFLLDKADQADGDLDNSSMAAYFGVSPDMAALGTALTHGARMDLADRLFSKALRRGYSSTVGQIAQELLHRSLTAGEIWDLFTRKDMVETVSERISHQRKFIDLAHQHGKPELIKKIRQHRIPVVPDFSI